MHPGDQETIDPDKCVELELLFKMGQCAGIRNGVRERVSPSDVDSATEAVRTCRPFTAAAAEGAIKRGFMQVDVLHREVGRHDGQRLPPRGTDGSAGWHRTARGGGWCWKVWFRGPDQSGGIFAS